MYKTELDWVSAYKKLEAELENKDKRIAEQGKGMNPSECCRNCKKWEIKEE